MMDHYTYMVKVPNSSTWSLSSLKKNVTEIIQKYDTDNDKGLSRAEFGELVKDVWSPSQSRKITEQEIDQVFKNFSGIPTKGDPTHDSDYATISEVEMANMLMAMDSQKLSINPQVDPQTKNNGIVEQDEFLAFSQPSSALPRVDSLKIDPPPKDPALFEEWLKKRLESHTSAVSRDFTEIANDKKPATFPPVDTYLLAHEAMKGYTEPVFGVNAEAAVIKAQSKQTTTESQPVTAQNITPENNQLAGQVLHWQEKYLNRQFARMANELPAEFGTTDKPFMQFVPEPIVGIINTHFQPTSTITPGTLIHQEDASNSEGQG